MFHYVFFFSMSCFTQALSSLVRIKYQLLHGEIEVLSSIMDYPYGRYSKTNRNCKMNSEASLTIQAHAREVDTPVCWIILWEQNNP